MRKTRVLLIGASQMGRLGEELMTMRVDLEVVGCMRMKGENTERKNMEMLRELEKKVGTVDMVVVGGPTNSLVRHGNEDLEARDRRELRRRKMVRRYGR